MIILLSWLTAKLTMTRRLPKVVITMQTAMDTAVTKNKEKKLGIRAFFINKNR
jgi:hypothetical protein